MKPPSSLYWMFNSFPAFRSGSGSGSGVAVVSDLAELTPYVRTERCPPIPLAGREAEKGIFES
jgi:hypothetical protein